MDKRNSLFKQAWELEHWATIFVSQTDGITFDPTPAAERYCWLLDIGLDDFDGQTVIDIGCGACGALSPFRAAHKFGVDLLSRSYQAFGTDQHDMVYISSPAEDMPFVDRFADAVLSVNALDHVDDLSSTLQEIARVLKVGGRALMAFNLDNEPTWSEPSPGSASFFRNEVRQWFEVTREKHWPPTNLPIGMDLAAPHGVLFLEARRTSTKDSEYVEVSRTLVDRIQTGEPPALQLLRLAEKWGAPRRGKAELYAATAFIFHESSDRAQASTSVLRAFWNAPQFMANRGLWSILLRSLWGAH